MGRVNTIDRDKVLAAAEKIVVDRGAAALTVDAVAKAVGITKGGVQSCFKTKDAMIDSMLARWIAAEDERFRHVLKSETPTPTQRAFAHIEVTQLQDEATIARSAGLLTVITQSPDHRVKARDWYTERLAGLDDDSEAARKAFVGFLAAEGAFFLRFLGLYDIAPSRWEQAFCDIKALTVSKTIQSKPEDEAS